MSQIKHVQFLGWDKDLAKEDFNLFGHTRQILKVEKKTGSGDITDGRIVKLWEFERKVNGGKDVKNIPQEEGDCVSWGARSAVVKLSAVEIIKNGDLEKFKDVFPPYIYGVSRCNISGNCGSRRPGSYGAAAAKGVERFGVIFFDTPGCPGYSGQIATLWGMRVPAEFLEVGKKYTIGATAQVTSTQDAAESIVSGYPFTIAADFVASGFKIKGDKVFATSGFGRGGHMQCCIGYDGTDNSFFIINSHGENSCPASPDGAPRGGYWIDERMLRNILAENDSFGYSKFNGFPEQELDKLLFNIIA